jgi:hypothetical protein
MRYELFEDVMLRLLRDDIDYKALSKQAKPIEAELKLQLTDTIAEIAQKEKLRSRYLRVIEGEAEPDEEIVTKFRAAGVELKRLKDKKESLEREINAVAPPKLTKIPMIEIHETREESNLRLKDEIRKRVARIQLDFTNKHQMIPDDIKKHLGVRLGKGMIVAMVTFVNGATKLAFFDGRKAHLFGSKPF